MIKGKVMDKIKIGQRVFDKEIAALQKTRDNLDSIFTDILDAVTGCTGKIIITGMGKPGHIAAKIAATFASLGTPACYLHPAEAMHGDLGMVTEKDVVIFISYSGESDEIIQILPVIKWIGAKTIAITGNARSTLAKNVEIVQKLPEFDEACFMGLAPTSSTTVELCYGDALAVAASEIYGFDKVEFGVFHPAGALGKQVILKVDDLMSGGEQNAVVYENALLKDAIIELGKKGLGIVSVVDEVQKLIGVITDGDLRRQLEKEVSIYELHVKDVMSTSPVSIKSGELAVNALELLKQKNINSLPVTNNNEVIGTIRLQDILNAGLLNR